MRVSTWQVLGGVSILTGCGLCVSAMGSVPGAGSGWLFPLGVILASAGALCFKSVREQWLEELDPSRKLRKQAREQSEPDIAQWGAGYLARGSVQGFRNFETLLIENWGEGMKPRARAIFDEAERIAAELKAKHREARSAAATSGVGTDGGAGGEDRAHAGPEAETSPPVAEQNPFPSASEARPENQAERRRVAMTRTAIASFVGVMIGAVLYYHGRAFSSIDEAEYAQFGMWLYRVALIPFVVSSFIALVMWVVEQLRPR